MTEQRKNLFIGIGTVMGLWVVYLLRRILKPFVLAAVFAYILSPLVNFLTTKTKLPRLGIVIFLYMCIVSVILSGTANVSVQLTRESRELAAEARRISQLKDYQLSDYPDWSRPVILDLARRINDIQILVPERLGPYFSGAVSGIEYTLIFLFSSFYFLKDGPQFIEKLKNHLPAKRKGQIGTLIQRVNQLLNNYLRGQIFLIMLMAVVSWIALSILGVKYSLILGIFTGFVEIIPFIGPLVAGAAAVLVAISDGNSMFALPPLYEGLVIAGTYFVFRMLEDYLVIPTVIGKTTDLHPLLVLFAVLAGGQLWGVLGMVLAVPVVVLVRLFILHLLQEDVVSP